MDPIPHPINRMIHIWKHFLPITLVKATAEDIPVIEIDFKII